MRAQGKTILVRPDEKIEKKGMILIPKTAKIEEHKGTAIDCGSECELVHKGDRILYKVGGASLVEIDDETLMFIPEENILYVYE